jgi:uncharacterized protein YbjT (DUF2867 family)
MKKQGLILVTGATGQQGGATALRLLKEGFLVRAMTRRPENAAGLAEAGAQVVTGDFRSPATLAAALRGVDGVFAMSTPFENGAEAEITQGIALAEAVQEAGVKHLVYSSVADANLRTGIPHFESKAVIEAHLKKLGVPRTILRPVWFMENFGTFLLHAIQRGELAAPMRPEKALQMVAVRDIAAFAAAAFGSPDRFLGRELDLAGDALTFPQVAAMLSDAMGHKVTFRRIPDDRAEKAVGPDFAAMYRWFNEQGYSVDIAALQRDYGIKPTRFADYVAAAPWARLESAAKA